jgi:TetR/AcrR family transcriptional repressor of lmrAB and yxaGH operons
VARTVTERADVLPALAEVFREFGFEGASLSVIGERTGLGKGSLYHFFPGGKEEMARCVLAEIEAWFDTNVFRPLREDDPQAGICHMLRAVGDYFQSGRRVCLVGAFAIGDGRDLFHRDVNRYFGKWIESLARALARAGIAKSKARHLAEQTIAEIQGAIILTRSMNDPAIFNRSLDRARTLLIPAR